MTDFDRLRERFPVFATRTYFATHCMGPTLHETYEDLDRYRRTLPLRNRVIEPWMERIDEVRRLYARVLGADEDEIALGPNATACQGAIAAALSPRPGRGAIVTTDLDFPSSRYLWHAQARRGFTVRVVPSRDGISLPTQALVDAMREDVAIVALPYVSYNNGALLDARRIVEAAHTVGAIVVLDAYQAVGNVPIDVHALGVDVLVAGSHKWLCAPSNGLAFLYVARGLANSLEPAYPGWFAHAGTLDFAGAFTPAPGARRFEQGSPAIEAIYAVRAGLRFVLEVGIRALHARSLALLVRVIAGTDALGLPLLTPREQHAGMICLGFKDPTFVAAELRARGIDVDTRPGTGIRISAHPCNNEDDCNRLLAVLAELSSR